MPKKTYVNLKEKKKRSALKGNKQRVTIGVGGNVAGHKLKPFLVHRHLNPRCMKGVRKSSLPVYLFATGST